MSATFLAAAFVVWWLRDSKRRQQSAIEQSGERTSARMKQEKEKKLTKSTDKEKREMIYDLVDAMNMNAVFRLTIASNHSSFQTPK